MAETATIKEYLVKLGFKVDDKSLNTFTKTVGGAEKAILSFVRNLTGAALAIGASVSAFASNLESLYFASKKTGASAENLKAFSLAAQNLGASSEDALGSIQSLARWMRETPSSEGFLQQLGVQTRDANGQLKDTTDLMLGLGSRLKEMPYFQAKQYANVFGVGEDTLRAMMTGEFAAELEKQRARLKDSGFTQATKDAHKFMEGLRELQTYLEQFAVRVQEALQKKLGGSMGDLSQWFQKNGPMIADRVADITIAILDLSNALAPAFGWIFDQFMALDKATGGWSTKIIALLGVMKMLGGFAVLSAIGRLAGALGTLGVAMAPIAASASAIAGFAALFYSKGLNSGEDEEIKKQRAQKPVFDIPPPAGWSPDDKKQRLQNLEKKYGLPSGLLDSVWSAESGRGKNMRSGAGAMGHFQFMPATAKQYGLENPDDFNQSSDAAARYYRDLMKRYGGNLQKAVAAYNWGPGNVDKNGLNNLPAETRGYLGKVIGGMGSGVQISQTTQINVTGARDPQATAAAIEGRQARVNGDIVRNFQTAVR